MFKYLFRFKNTKAFTLVELSIVIVVIGLIISAVTAGSSLVRQAKVKNIITDKNKYSVAANTFKLQYGTIPGDLINSNSYWPTSTPGNGDGWVDWGGANDWLSAWEHLSLSGLITNTYARAQYPQGSTNGDVLFISQPDRSIYQLPHFNSFHFVASLKATEAFGLDTKIDDGDPTTGRLLGVSPNPFVAGCMDAFFGGGAGSANYVLTSSVANCHIYFPCYSRKCVP